jgi:hypothetical protein
LTLSPLALGYREIGHGTARRQTRPGSCSWCRPIRYADGPDGAELAAEAEAGADDAGADAGAELVDAEADEDAVAVAVAVAVGVVDVVGVGVGVGVLDLVGVGVGVTTAGRTDDGVYAGALDGGTLCEADGEVDALLGALDDDAGAEDVTAAGWSLSWAGGCLVAELTTKTAAPIAPSITPMIRASMSGRTRRRRGGRFPPPGPGPYSPTGGVGGALPSGDVGELYPWGGVCETYPGGGVSVPAPAAAVRVGPAWDTT